MRAIVILGSLIWFNLGSDVVLGQAHFQGLGDLPGGTYLTLPGGISSDGKVVVGWSVSDAGSEAFRWTEMEGMIGLGFLTPENFFSAGAGASEEGAVIAGQATSPESTPNTEAFRWTEDQGMVALGDLPGGFYNSEARDVSADGTVVVGWSDSSTGSQAFRWTEDEGIVALGDLPGGVISSSGRAVSADGSVIVGSSTSDAGGEAFHWTAEEGMVGVGDLPGGGFSSRAFDVSADGSVIVGDSLSSNGWEAFRWTEEEGMVGLGDLPGGVFDSRAQAVSADGSIIVGCGCVSGSEICFGGLEPFIWDAKHGMRNLREVLEGTYGLDLSGWDLVAAGAVSADGLTIVGGGNNQSGAIEGWIVWLPDCNGNGIADDLDILDGVSNDANNNVVPDECECQADLNDDGTVGPFDLAVLLSNWGPCPDTCPPVCMADLSGDCIIGAFDLALLLGAWGPCP